MFGRKNRPRGVHRALRPLVTDHELIRSEAERLERAAGEDANGRRTALIRFEALWVQEIGRHQVEEEQLLGPLIRNVELRGRMLREHRLLRAMAARVRPMQLETDPDPAWIENFAHRLVANTRWEERFLYPAIESAADPARLARLGRDTRTLDRRRDRRADP